jgi:trehalose-phosphatase
VHDLGILQTVRRCKPSAKCLHTAPAALEHLDNLAKRIRGHALALFLDYDGTLTPIVRRPEEAILSDEMRSLVGRLARRCAVAVISGRDRPNVEQMVQVEKVVYAGSHGFDVRGPDGLEMQYAEARQALPELDQAERTLRQRTRDIQGARVERKRFAIAVHYREVPRADDVERVEKAVDEVRAEHPNLRKRGGKKVFELQPDVEWDKGFCVAWLARQLGFFRAGAVVVYIGDDETDEDAFEALRRGGLGIGIRVALPTAGTHAQYYLRDCGEVRRFLTWLLGVLEQGQAAAG